MPLHIETPLVHSLPLSRALSNAVHLKLEALQPSGSFKIRGVGRACEAYAAAGCTEFIASSGGNAGLAVAYAGHRLGMPVAVFVPTTTPESMRRRIRDLGANVVEFGSVWDEAHARAEGEAAAHEDRAYIHPFDDPLLWEGHATLIHEIAATSSRPDAIVLSVGGGGLLIGVLQGLHAVGWDDVPVYAVETDGAASYARSVAKGALVTLDEIDSVAKSLGAATVSATALEWYDRHPIRPVQVSDRAAIDAVVRFAEDHRILVEPACGAALSLAYDGEPSLRERDDVVVVCCGGAGVSRAQIDAWDALPR